MRADEVGGALGQPQDGLLQDVEDLAAVQQHMLRRWFGPE